MKTLMTLVFTVVLALALTTSAFAQPSVEKSDAGKVGLIFVFNGLDNLGVSPFNGGIGAKYYLNNNIALRGSLGGFYTKTDDGSTNQFDISGGILWELLKGKNTAGYIGPEIGFATQKGSDGVNQNAFALKGIVGGEFEVFHNVALGAEYHILYSNQTNPSTWSVSLANNTTSFLLNIYF